MGPIPRGRALACLRPGHARTATLAAAAAWSLAAVAAAPAAQAQTADACANADVRAQQVGGNLLPDCRAYELVSPDQMGNQAVLPRVVSADGDKIAWGTDGPLPGGPASIPNELRSVRTANGWRMDSALAPFTINRPSTIQDKQTPAFVDVETGARIFTTTYPFFPGDLSGTRVPLTGDDVIGMDPTGELRWITRPTSGSTPTGIQNVPHWVLAATPDLSRVLVESHRAMTPEVPADIPVSGANRPALYLTEQGKPARLVSVAPGATTRLTNYARSGSIQRTFASKDLETITFEDDAGRIYARLHASDPARAQTIELTRGPTVGADPAVPGSGTPGVCQGAKSLAMDPEGVTFALRCNTEWDGTGSSTTYFRDLRILDPDDPGAFEEVPGFPEARHFATSGLDTAFDIQGRFVRRHGVIRPLLPVNLTNSQEIRMSRDGRYVVALSQSIPGVDLGGTMQVMLVDLDEPDPAEATTCVSCPTDGSVPTAGSTPKEHQSAPNARARYGDGSGVLAQDGSRVVFQTAQPLVPRDTNGQVDVYLWQDDEHHLLSSGTAPQASQLVEASADGSTIFITTTDALVPQDVDGTEQDLYAVRVGGGFLASSAVEPPAACVTDCQPAVAPPTPVVAQPTELLRGGQNATQERTPSVRLRLSGTRTVRGTRGVVKAKVSGPGVLSISGSGVRRESRAARNAATYSLAVTLTDAAKRTLRRTGKASATVTVRYQPLAGATRSLRRTLEFRVAKTKAKTATNAKKGDR